MFTTVSVARATSYHIKIKSRLLFDVLFCNIPHSDLKNITVLALPRPTLVSSLKSIKKKSLAPVENPCERTLSQIKVGINIAGSKAYIPLRRKITGVGYFCTT